MSKNLQLKKLDVIDKPFLESIYIESEFIDPIVDIIERYQCQKECNKSTPFLITGKNEIVAFFTIESSNINVTGIQSEKGIYWLESFFITKKFLGKGYSKKAVTKMLEGIKIHFPAIIYLKLSVNLRNEVAQKVYKNSGFKDSQKKYYGGPAGPQALYKYKITC